MPMDEIFATAKSSKFTEESSKSILTKAQELKRKHLENMAISNLPYGGKNEAFRALTSKPL